LSSHYVYIYVVFVKDADMAKKLQLANSQREQLERQASEVS
jgi:hypothetical protein